MKSWSNKPNTMNFIEYGSKNQILMSWATANMELRENQAQIKRHQCQWMFSPRRPKFNVYLSQLNIKIIQYATVFSLPLFSTPHSWGLFHIIQLLSDHLDLTLVNHLDPHLSTHPITPLSAFCELWQPRQHCSGVLSTLMRPEKQLQCI